MGNPIRCVTINAVSPIKEAADALHARRTVPVGLRPCILFRLLAVWRRVNGKAAIVR